MSVSGFTIAKVVVQGQGKPDAVLEFGPGLNVVAGASDTGKTYAWQLIDFMLGASKPPKVIPEATGYGYAMLELRPRAGGVLTLQRALAGGAALAYPAPIDGITGDTPSETLAEQHSAQNALTISGRLLAMSGLGGKQIRKNADGVKRSLSFRDVAWLALVDEERIIAERSPVLTGQYSTPTEEKSAFGFFIMGVDDADIIPQEAAKDRKQRLQAEMAVLQRLIDDRKARLDSFGVDAEQLPSQRARLATAVQEATDLLAVRQTELDGAAEERDRAWSAIEAIKSKQLFLAEQLKRLELLEQHYASDKSRLESALEAGEFFERMPTGECPVCGHNPGTVDEDGASDQRLKEFQQACRAEIGRIDVLARDLGVTLTAMRTEDGAFEREKIELRRTLERANAAMRGLLDRKVRAADAQLSQLLVQQSRLAEAAFAANELLDLRTRYSVAEQQTKAKTPRIKIAPKVGAAGTAEFCKMVEETLRAWKFPFVGNVSWADREFDLVVGDKNRGSMGKGMRAITHAAFTVSLLRYCRAKNLPHPGIVVIDTPLNPYRGADKTSTEGMNMDVQEAFYTDLASDQSGDQVIVFENTEPPVAVRSRMRYAHFSRNPANPPVGFFPAPPSPIAQTKPG